MSSRQRSGLAQLAAFRRLQTDHLEDLMFAGSDVTPRSRQVLTSRILRRLRRRGFIEAIRRPTAGPRGGSGELIYGVTEVGCSYLARSEPAFRGVRPPPRDAASIEHALMAADVYAALLRTARARSGHALSPWDADWCAAELLGTSRVVPDGHLVYVTPEWELDAFIEIDLGTESPSRFARKVAEYIAVLRGGTWQAQLPTWPLVLTVAPSNVRATTLRRASESVLRREPDRSRLATIALFYFASLSDLLAATDPLGLIWQLAGSEERCELIPASAELVQ